MGCKKITYQNFSFLEVIHRKNATAFKKNRCNGDHLGNVRLSYADSDGNGSIDASTEIISENSYYPFGLEHKGANNVINGTENNYQTYLGKEHNESLDLNIYEMDWRQYDPALGRFNIIDKLADSFVDNTPYHYGYNNPILYKDPSGLFSTVVNDDGEVIEHKDDGDPNIYLNSRDGVVLGQEAEGATYNIGDKLFNVDRSNHDYAAYSLVVNLASTLYASAPVIVAINNIPQSIPVYDEAGNIIGKWFTKIKVPFKALKLVNGVLQVAGPVGDAISITSDTVKYANGEISTGRYAYRTGGTGVALTVTYLAGGLPGVVVGGGFYVGEMIYDSSKDREDPDNNANTIHSIGEFFRHFKKNMEFLPRRRW